MALDVQRVRRSFPALTSDTAFLDNPGGTQICRPALDRIRQYLTETNANHGGAFATSQASDALINSARGAAADFLGARRPHEIVFGPNMTSLTLNLSRSLARTLTPEDEIIVTRLDHDANISPWLHVAEAIGCRVHWVDFDVEDCTLDLNSFHGALNENTALVAVGYASNAVGTVNPVRELVEASHEVGALCYVDAVQLAPHSPIDVQELGADFLVFSAYKVFGPHIGVLYGRHDLLDALPAFKVRPAPERPPGKFETGTQNHEGIAGLLGALEYLAELGREYGGDQLPGLKDKYSGQALDLRAGMSAIEEYERGLSDRLLTGLGEIRGLRLFGHSDSGDLHRRVPTVSFRLGDLKPRRVAELLGELGIYVWDGNFYALAVTERLGLEEKGGLVRVGLVHYNTAGEVDRLLDGLTAVQAG